MHESFCHSDTLDVPARHYQHPALVVTPVPVILHEACSRTRHQLPRLLGVDSLNVAL